MAAVTIDAGAQNSYYSAGNIGWSARSIFAYRTAIQQLASGALTNWGNSTSVVGAGQSFTTVGAIDVNEIRMPIAKVGTPADNISCQIYSDTGASVPNASIATADNLYNGAALSTSTTSSWLTFQFATPVSLSASTKYWMVFERSGAVDASNYYVMQRNTGSAYSGGGRATHSDAPVWSSESATDDFCFQILTETPSALYAVTQSTEPALHVWKSTDSGASWSEQDSSNNPSVTNANYPFSACDTRSGPYIGTAYFTATNTLRGRAFNMSTDTWDTVDWNSGNATAGASNERTIRVNVDNTFVTASLGSQVISYTSSTDDADLLRARRSTSTWTTDITILSINSASASLISDVVTDKAPIGFDHRFYYDIAAFDYFMRSLIGPTPTNGTQTAVVTDAADVETEHCSATYQIYQASGRDKIIAAFINADGSIQERTALLEVTSASVTLGTEHAVGTATTTAGRQLSTCEYSGDGYVVANVSGTGLDYYVDSGLAGSWSAATNWKTGLTACTLSQVISVTGVGLAVVYTDNGDVKIDWIDGGPAADVTINGSLATGSGAAYSALIKPTIQGSLSTATAEAYIALIKPTIQGSLSTATAAALDGTVIVPIIILGSLSTATSAALSGLIKPTIQGSLSTGTGAALDGAPTFDVLGSIAAASALARDGTVIAPQTILGSLATGSGAANLGNIVIDIPGSLATGSGAATSGSLIAALTGSVAAADGVAYSGALDFTFAGSLATADAAALDGSLAVVIVGTTSLADAVANDGDVLLGYTVLGSLATATAQANDGTGSETGVGDDEPRSGIFQLRPLVAVEAA
jgi:hypothetical protein